MRVFTVTYLSKNYGTVLQAYALQQAIKACGAEPVLVRKQIDDRHKKTIGQKLLSFFKPVKNYSLSDRVKILVYRKQFALKAKKVNDFVKDKLNVMNVKTADSVIAVLNKGDILLAGSDQIWSIMSGTVSDWYTFQWEGLPETVRMFSYAASIGVSSLEENQKLTYKSMLSKFHVISFREKKAMELLGSYLTQPVRYDLDPTLLYGESFWSDIAAKRIETAPYIFIYMLRPDENLIRMGQQLGKELGCKVIYTGQMADHYKGVQTVCDAGIEEFLSYIKYADRVITNSFHGTVFSVLFRKKFISVRIASTGSRAANLLELAGLMSQYIDNINQLDAIHNEIDYESAFARLAAEREKSLRYIHEICR